MYRISLSYWVYLTPCNYKFSTYSLFSLSYAFAYIKLPGPTLQGWAALSPVEKYQVCGKEEQPEAMYLTTVRFKFFDIPVSKFPIFSLPPSPYM